MNDIENFVGKHRRHLIIIGLLLGLASLSQFTSMSTISQYQGIHPSFVAIYHNGQYYTTANPYEASISSIGPSTLNFDPDFALRGLPNIQGELRDIQIVRDLANYEVADTASHILGMGGKTSMPYKIYEWEIMEKEELHKYRMELWLCSLDVNLWVKPDARPWWMLFEDYENQMRYDDAEVWLKMEVGPSWYFEDAENVYFGLGYMELAELTQANGQDNSLLEVIPESKWAAFDVYDSLGGIQEGADAPATQAITYQGKLLNPEVFRQEWYTKFTLSDFGCYDYSMLDGSYKSDSIQFKILVHTFVVGEWIVKPDEEHDMEEHESSAYEGWLQSIENWVGTPLGGLTLGAGIPLFLYGALMIVLFWTRGFPKLGGGKKDE